MTIAKECEGCQSNKKFDNILYYECKRRLAISNTDVNKDNLHRIFRKQYCPCKTCLVKATCTEPKVSIFTYDSTIIYSKNDEYHKCKLLANQIALFHKDIIYDFLVVYIS
jgi:hypothetical protein